MKITVIGGGGVRGPLFVASALHRANAIGLDEISLMDIRPDKLEIMAAISRQVAVMMESPVRITHTTDPVTAVMEATEVTGACGARGRESR